MCLGESRRQRECNWTEGDQGLEMNSWSGYEKGLLRGLSAGAVPGAPDTLRTLLIVVK